MLNPDGPAAKQQAIQRRLITKTNRPSPKQVAHDNRVNDKIISDSIIRQTAPPPNKPAYKPPASKPLSTTKTGPAFNPKAKIDKSQVEDRTQSDNMDKFMHRLAKNKNWEQNHPGTNYPAKKKQGPVSMGIKGNKEALLKRLREK